MPTDINWQNLRPLDGSQHTAFEELCCQLARYKKVQPGATFVRKGPPDAGIECYWKLANGDEWGWQAKFFLSPPNESQWHQLDESVKAALEKHPHLTLYTICLPIDRQDPRIDNEKWFMDRWDERIKKWQGLAKEKGMSVEFSYWGEHEIWERLSREEHRGRYFFWFDEELFSSQWFRNRIEEAVANVGPRYTPELNIELPIARLFDGLGHTSDFFNRIKVQYRKIKKSIHTQLRRTEELAKDKFDSLQENISQLLLIMKNVEEQETSPIDWNCIDNLASKTEKIAWETIECLKTAVEKMKKEPGSPSEQGIRSDAEGIRYEQYHLQELITHLRDLRDFAQSSEALLFNTQALLLVGYAGTGKTHLFCDIAKQRVHSGLPTVLLLGGQFYHEEPWSQIIHLLGLSYAREEFLGALESAAQARGAKALILIDALNEGEGKNLWEKHLAGMLTTLLCYPWVGIAFSVRTSYENLVISEGLVPNRLIREVHLGFAEHEYQATRTFFDYFGIKHPSIPLLAPEFQNPLFLKLFCQGLKNLGLTSIPSGIQGITAVFNLFIESVNGKLSRPEYLDFDLNSQLVQKAVEKLAEIMADKGKIWLPREVAQAAVNEVLPHNGYEKSLFRHMISEGLLAEDRFLIEDNKLCEGIHFSYERFTDHLVAKHLIDKHLNPTNPSQSFLPDQPLGTLIKDERACWRNRGLVEAFSIQIPERIRMELGEVAPHCADFLPVIEAFVESLIWRDPKAINETTLNYINKHVINYEETHNQFLNALLTIASNPNHPYNADFLHKHLMKFELAERDAWWSIFLHSQYGTHGAVDRLVDWAWSLGDKRHIDDESIRLCGIALAWFLTTSNRYLRDRATKALVSLLTKRIPILRQIIRNFLDVNDPYVLERLFAAAYGCAMRSTDNNAIGDLAKDVYEWVFKNGTPPPHILLRDYARGIVELALHRGIELDIDIEKVRPPYKSEWPSDFPAEEEIKKYGKYQEGMPDHERARVYLYNSVMDDLLGDYAKYIITPYVFKWSSCRLGESRKPSKKEMYKTFVQSLTNRQKKEWDSYCTTRGGIDAYKRLDKDDRLKISTLELSEEELEVVLLKAEKSFCKTIGKKKHKVFKEYVIPYLNDPYKDEYRFDLSIAQRWILKKVFDLGWTVGRFGWFDRDATLYSNYGREANKPERIGKKYQWIAFHEFLARVSDNFEFRGDSWDNSFEKYEGPWQIGYTRNIDPSFLLKKTGKEGWEPHSNTWWFTSSYNTWDSEPDDISWLKSHDDIPAIEPLIEVTNPDDGSQWLTLEAYYRWEQPTPLEEERFTIPRRDIWYALRSYIVKKSDMEALFRWTKHQDFMNRWMPESRHLIRVFMGEFFESPAYRYHCTPYHRYEEWTRGDDNCIPKEVLVTCESYFWELGTYDCSIDDAINIHLPCKWLVDHLGLRWNGVEGQLFDGNGNLVAFDPSVRTPGPGALLINRDVFLKFLNENGYDILWTILGQKGVIGGRMSPEDFKGRLKISGAFRIRAAKLEGKINPKFISPRDE